MISVTLHVQLHTLGTNIMHISRDEQTPWINLKFAWYSKIFIWLINFILITKTFFTVDHVQSTCIDSYQSFKVSLELRLQHEQSWKVQGFVKEKKCPLQCECYLKLWSIQTSKVHVKVCCLSVQFVCLYQAIC